MIPRRTVVSTPRGLATVELPARWGDDPADELRAFVDDFRECPNFGVPLEGWDEHPDFPGIKLKDDGSVGVDLYWGFPARDLFRELRSRGINVSLSIDRWTSSWNAKGEFSVMISVVQGKQPKR